MQIFSFLFILSYSKLFNLSSLYSDVSLVFASVFAIVFSFSYSKGTIVPVIKNKRELFEYTLFLVFIIATAFYHYMLFEYLPYTIIYFLLFTSLVFNLKEDINAKMIYVIGWSIVCVVLYFTNAKELYYQKEYIDLVLVAFSIEALLFTISVAYSYRYVQNQNSEYEQLIIEQSKLAKSGAMIENITHQFRQPLNSISYILINIKKKFSKEKLTQVYLEKKIEQANSQLQFLSKTIDDFKDFYQPSKIKDDFSVKDSILRTLTVISSDLKKQRIIYSLKFLTNEEIKIYGISNELSQVMLILLSNALDALVDIENPQIQIVVKATPSEVIIEVIDNARGIKNIDSIFTPYYSTKEEGFGIGLSLAKNIIDKSFQGSIKAENIKEESQTKGARFTLCLIK